MGRRCCIAGCPSTSRLPEHHGVTYHSFPLDTAIRAVWMRNTRFNADRQITKSVLVCSRHFRRADFQPQRSGKYLLKHRVFPTVFPWGKIDPVQVDADLEELKIAGATTPTTSSAGASIPQDESSEDATKATVEANVAEILARTAELNAAAGLKSESGESSGKSDAGGAAGAAAAASSPMGVKFEPVTTFNPGTRLEAQDFDGIWHSARVVEVDNDDREVLIKFERTGKTKSAVIGTEEWIPMNSTRLRQKVSTRPILVFELEEKCMARWSGPRKFPGTIKKLLSNDMYEVLFDDGYVKNVRAIHMNKVQSLDGDGSGIASPDIVTTEATSIVNTGDGVASSSTNNVSSTPSGGVTATKGTPASATGDGGSKKRPSTGSRKDWPLLDMSKLDLVSLNLPDIPKDGEWTCHWVNDQPIGKEGFLVVGEHRKPTVIVEDWRLPPGWVKHMYQRSNVLGKWDVILVTPNKKRFRSKADLKVYLEEQGQVYNPDIYDFSIHRRRAKDINAYVYTPDYVPQQPPKPKSTLDSTFAANDSQLVSEAKAAAAALASLAAGTAAQFIETPVATPMPPMELMTPTTPTTGKSPVGGSDLNASVKMDVDVIMTSTPETSTLTVDDGYAFIGGLKVQVVDNLFRCPQEGCSKNFRKENHLQIHVKHYHQDLIKLLGACPKMQELAEKRTHTSTPDPTQTPLKESPTQSRAQQRKVPLNSGQDTPVATDLPSTPEIKTEKLLPKTEKMDLDSLNVTATSALDTTNATLDTTANSSTFLLDHNESGIPAKRSRFSPVKRSSGSRKSNRQRTTRRYLTAAQATAGAPTPLTHTNAATTGGGGDSSFGVSDFEETRHSFNATPDVAKTLSDVKKRKPSAAAAVATAAAMSMSSLDSPVTADSGSSSFQALQPPSSNETAELGAAAALVGQPQYIKVNGEMIKIVRMRQEEIISCLCGYGEEDGLMIQCELCLCWQHGVCNGIDQESDVPDKYVCYICRNPQRGRESVRFKHDQDWLYEGKLPVANYYISNPDVQARFDFLKKSHTLTGNLIELKQFMHSLKVKINIANNRVHPKLYLWAKKWDDDTVPEQLRHNSGGAIKFEQTQMPNIPQPEAPIDPVECQQRLLEHITVQQNLVMNRLSNIEGEIDALEKLDTLPDMKDADYGATKDLLATFIKELDIVKQIARLNVLENTKRSLKNQPAVTVK